MTPSRMPRPVLLRTALLAAALASGCSSSQEAPRPAPSASISVTSQPPSPEAAEEPSAVISYAGKTKIVTVGDVEIRATANEAGINVACNVTNTSDEATNIKVTVSVGDGDEWVTTNNFEFRQVSAGKSASQTTLMATSYADDLPEDPKVYIDSVQHY
ncbi:hypothetical protein [Streptomyces halobius]|uniref:Lipoprotein n=1 Tax=Streptomyces halobius TaxID=2879846 RepID=A0ABY4MHH7_9ACTN|nr:hypothetical protein [Streptomyces halobius]UQA96707.1 hypothetical protein K9S39_36885 [Streptomyces halobius]